MNSPLQALSTDTVSNVYLFVADSVRADYTSDEITELGVSGRAIAGSTYTASSFPSIVSGQYPATHRVWSFQDRLSEVPSLLTGPEAFVMSAETIWTDLPPKQKPPFKMIGATDEHAGEIQDVEPPFVAIEHHKGGHLPFGYSFDEYESANEFFAERRPALSELPGLYEASVRDAEQKFLSRLDSLDERGLLDETLVIYTSDHGETFGEPENGMAVGHGDLISPDLVDVPVVFAGGSLPDRTLDAVLSGTDIAPTALSALGRPDPESTNGRDLWTNQPTTDRRVRSELWLKTELPLLGEVERYRATSIWDGDGGFVLQRGSAIFRLALGIAYEFFYKPSAYLNRHPRNIHRWLGFLRTYGHSTHRHGNPGFSEDRAREAMQPFEESLESPNDGVPTEQLRKLGYLE